jgi:hypothetical protein
MKNTNDLQLIAAYVTIKVAMDQLNIALRDLEKGPEESGFEPVSFRCEQAVTEIRSALEALQLRKKPVYFPRI